MINLMATMAEAQLYVNWVPFCTKSTVHVVKTNFRKMAEFEVAMPWPLYHRACFIQACGMQLPEENAWILTLNSVKNDKWFGHEIKRNPDMVYVDVNRATFYFKQLDADTQLLQVIGNSDPHMPLIPAWLINFGLKVGCSAFLDLL